MQGLNGVDMKESWMKREGTNTEIEREREREGSIVCKGNRRFGILFRWFRGQVGAYLVE